MRHKLFSILSWYILCTIVAKPLLDNLKYRLNYLKIIPPEILCILPPIRIAYIAIFLHHFFLLKARSVLDVHMHIVSVFEFDRLMEKRV